MKATHRKALRHSLTLVLLAALTYGAWLLLRPPTEGENRLSSAEAQLDARIGKLTDRSADEAKLSERRNAAVKLATDQWFGELLERYPWMQVEYRDVPDAQNGRLLYAQLLSTLEGDVDEKSLPIPPEIRRQLEGRDEFNPKLLTQWFEENQNLWEQILIIAEAPERSVKNITYHDGYTNPRPLKAMGELLNIKARLAMLEKDMASAKRHAAAAMNLAAHMDQTEAPTLLEVTIAMTVQVETRSTFQQHILPSLPQNAESLTEWREIFACAPDHDHQLERIAVGEWRVITRDYILPGLLRGHFRWNVSNGRIQNPQAFLDAYAHVITRIFGQDTLPDYDPFTYVDPADLAGTSKELMEEFLIGSKAWHRGLNRSATETAMNDALLAILTGEEPPVDPISGKPFIWDEETCTIHPPEGAKQIEPIILN